MPEYPSGRVTFLFTDIEGSTHRWERATAAIRVEVKRLVALLRSAAKIHGGVLFKTVVDAAQAAFRIVSVALAAVIAAKHALAAQDWDQLRVARWSLLVAPFITLRPRLGCLPPATASAR
jgi:class 3 adenylate cyclase